MSISIFIKFLNLLPTVGDIEWVRLQDVWWPGVVEAVLSAGKLIKCGFYTEHTL